MTPDDKDRVVYGAEPLGLLVYPYQLDTKELNYLEERLTDYRFTPEEINFLLFDERKRPENFNPKTYYDRVTSCHASRVSLEEEIGKYRPLTVEEFVNLSIGYVTTTIPEKKKFFDETFPKTWIADWHASASALSDEFAKWALVENLLMMRVEPRNAEPVMLAAAFADISYDSSWHILHGGGKTRGGKPYPALIYRTQELIDFLYRGHLSVFEILGGIVIANMGSTRYDFFTNNSQYGAEFGGLEESSSRDLTKITHIMPDEFENDKKIDKIMDEFTAELDRFYRTTLRTGGKIPTEDVSYSPLFCALTSGTLYFNPLYLASKSGEAYSNPDETMSFRKFMQANIDAASQVLPTAGPRIIEASKAAGWTSPPNYFEKTSNDFGSETPRILNISIPQNLRNVTFDGQKDPKLKGIIISVELEGSGRMQAQFMRHNYVVENRFESLPHAADRWFSGQTKAIEPPEIAADPRAHGMFWYLDELAHDLYKLARDRNPSAAGQMAPMSIPVRSMATFNGLSYINFDSQRVDQHAQWEIRRYARKLHNQIELNPESPGFLTSILHEQLAKYVASGEAKNVVVFIPELMGKTKVGV